MNTFETNRKNFRLLPISIIMGIGSFYYGFNIASFSLQKLFLIAGGFFFSIGIPLYALLSQKRIDINHLTKNIVIFYPILNRRINFPYDQIDSVKILKNIYDSKGMYHDEIIIISKQRKIKFVSNEFAFYNSLENKLKHELKDKIEMHNL